MANDTMVWLGGENEKKITKPICDVDIPDMHDIGQNIKPGVTIEKWAAGVEEIFKLWSIAIHLKHHIQSP